MNPTARYSRLRPAVPRFWLLGIAGAIWTAAGTLLCLRGLVWLFADSLLLAVALELAGAALAVAFFSFGFTRIAQKNIHRIHGLPDRACVFAFTSWRGYLMIGGMMTLGITLRNSALPKEYLAVPYTAMGGALLLASARFFGRFRSAAFSRERSSRAS